jgi:pimeloyl-ACP methyl ester carboxylesterase
MSDPAETTTVPHLGGTQVGHRFARPYDRSLPTLVMVNSFTTTVDLYRPQFASDELAGTANLLAVEPYGHGATRSPFEHFTYWDTAHAVLQLLDALGVGQAFVLGTSQGGWVAARTALLAPDRIRGIIPLGTSMDFESPRSRELGCWDGVAFCTPAIDALAAPVGDDWVIPGELVDAVLHEGLGDAVTADERAFWHATYSRTYVGDEGRQRLRMCTINLRDRDGLLGRLDGVRCPVLWMHGTADAVYSVANAEDGVARMVNADAELRVVEGGQHFLSASDPDAVNAAAVEFLRRHG